MTFAPGTRILTGTPTTAGSASLTLTATDSDSDTADLTVSMTIAQGTQPLSGGRFSSSPLTFGFPAPTATITAPTNSAGDAGGVISYTSTTTGVCTVAGTVVTAVGAGDCIIDAQATGNANYTASNTLRLPTLSSTRAHRR